MQQLQLWIFWAIVAAFLVCGCILTRKPTKKPPIETLRPAGWMNVSPAVSLSKKKGALIGRAAGEPYRPRAKRIDITGVAGLDVH